MISTERGIAERSRLAEIAERCIHCGLCLEDCPTYQVLGNEMDSPRGRILLMRGWVNGLSELTPRVRTHLDRCLDCRACESACPSGVQYGALIEQVRGEVAATQPAESVGGITALLRDWLIFEILPHPARMRWAIRLGRIAERLGLNELAAWLSPALAPLMRMLPKSPAGRTERITDLPGFARAPDSAAARSSVVLFTGCATSVLTPQTVANTHRVLLHNGCAVHCPRSQGCCGAIHYHGGRPDDARRMAKVNIDAFSAPGVAEPRTADSPAASSGDAAPPIVTIAAGCGAMLREYGHLLSDDPDYAERAREFAARVRDVSEFLWTLGPVKPTHALASPNSSAGAASRVTYHDPCHLAHAQRITAAPRALLKLIPGIELVECREASMCCGAAGTYNLLQPQIATELGRRKLQNLAATGAPIAATGNIGCILHLRALAAAAPSAAPRAAANTAPCDSPEIVHTIDLLHAAYGLTPAGRS